MNPNRAYSYFSIFIIVLLVSACSPSMEIVPANTELPPMGEFETEIVPMTLTGAEVIWPELTAAENCSPGIPAPTIKICIKNESEKSASPEKVHIAVPAALAPDAQSSVLGSLPGGEWLVPIPLALTGIPGFNENAEGIIIINNNPAPDNAAEGIIIINTMPGDPEGSEGIIIINTFPTPTSAEGIIIINNKEGAYALMGEITIEFDFTAMSLEGSGASFGFDEAAADITQDGKPISGFITEMIEFTFIKNYHHMPKGIIWGGLVANATEEMINSSPVTVGIEYTPPPDDRIPPPDDGKTAIVWGGMPTDAAGIIIINNLPSPGSEAEGIIIVGGKDISQVMGINIEDKPGNDAASKGIIIVGGVPVPQTSQGISWNSIVWGGTPVGEPGSEGIIIVGGMPAVSSHSATRTGLPAGFGLPEGFIPMMGQEGFGPHAMALGTIHLQERGIPLIVAPGEEECIEILLTTLLPQLPGSGGDSFPVDSFFDVFTELTVDLPQEGGSSTIVSRIAPPTYPVCTPTPSPISPVIPELAAPTPTKKSAQPPPPPKPTIRTGLPTVAPTQDRRLPTPTPGRGSN